jgi:glycosyltransferase involved in cell wall biosynthesis
MSKQTPEIKRLLVTDNDPAAGSWYRGVAAHEALGKQFRNELRVLSKRTPIGEDIVHAADALFFFRPYQKGDLETIQFAKELGLNTCSDWDDCTLDIPYSHPDYLEWANEYLVNSWVKCFQASKIITTTTNYLAKRFSEITGKKEVFVVPNALDDRIVKRATAPKMEDVPRMVIWRGGKTHSEDLSTFKEVFRILQKEQVRLVFFGNLQPHAVRDVLIDSMWSHVPPFSPVPAYYRMLAELNAPVQVIPLADYPLNHGKSNIAWLEGSYIGGSVCVQPEFFNADEPNKKGTAVTYEKESSPETIANAILGLLESPALRETILANAQALIKEKYLSSIVNAQRFKIYSEHLF